MPLQARKRAASVPRQIPEWSFASGRPVRVNSPPLDLESHPVWPPASRQVLSHPTQLRRGASPPANARCGGSPNMRRAASQPAVRGAAGMPSHGLAVASTDQVPAPNSLAVPSAATVPFPEKSKPHQARMSGTLHQVMDATKNDWVSVAPLPGPAWSAFDERPRPGSPQQVRGAKAAQRVFELSLRSDAEVKPRRRPKKKRVVSDGGRPSAPLDTVSVARRKRPSVQTRIGSPHM